MTRHASALGSGAWILIAVAALWSAIALHMADARLAALAAAEINGVNLARAFEESLIHTIGEIDRTLLYVRDLHARGGELRLEDWVHSIGPGGSPATQLSMADRNGIVVISNLRAVHERIDLSDRPHFRFFADHADDVLYISVPVIGRVSGKPTLQFVRRLSRPEAEGGGFDGIVVLSMAPGDLVRFYQSIDIGPHGTVTLTGRDGVIRAGAGGTEAQIGQHSLSPTLGHVAEQQEDHFQWTDPRDGVARMTIVRAIAGTSLVVEVGLSTEDTLAPVSRDHRRFFAGGVALSVLIVTVGFVVHRHRRHLAQARMQLGAALENINQGLLMVDRNDRIAVLNQRARELLDLPSYWTVGKSFAALVKWQRSQGEFAAGTPDDLRTRIEHDPRPQHSLPPRYIRARPNGRVLEVTTTGLIDGSAVRTFADITEFERAQEALSRARDLAEAGMHARARFLAVMSHEIRTPLNGIIGAANLLAEARLSAETSEYITIVQQSSQHLLALVNDILDAARIEHNAVMLESIPFSPTVVLNDVLAMLAPQMRAAGLSITTDLASGLPDAVSGDPARLRQVLLNLVSNAVKFTRVGGISVRMAATSLDTQGWRLEIAVRDTGIGIPADMISQLFQDFTQIDGSITRRFGGTGLGLAISRRLIEALGGTIAVESVVGEGSEFRFWIVVEAASKSLPSAPPQTIDGLPPLRVLLAEDNEINRTISSEMLRRLGCTVISVADGAQAVAAVKDVEFGLILMDTMMPELDGPAATRAIRALPGKAGATPIIALSANAAPEDRAECRAAGMNGFVAKPATLEQLRCALASLFAPQPTVDPVREASTLERLTESVGAEVVAQMVDVFRTELPGRLEELGLLAAAGDVARLERACHALAGSAATLGLDVFSAKLRAIEHSLRAGEPAKAAEALAPALAAGWQAIEQLVGDTPQPVGA